MPDDDWLPKCPACQTPCAEHVGSPVPGLFRCVCGSCSHPFWVELVPDTAPRRTRPAEPKPTAEVFVNPKLLSVIKRRRMSREESQ